MPHGITQCYLPPGRGDIPALTPAKAGTRFSDPGGMQGWVDLVSVSRRLFRLDRLSITNPFSRFPVLRFQLPRYMSLTDGNWLYSRTLETIREIMRRVACYSCSCMPRADDNARKLLSLPTHFVDVTVQRLSVRERGERLYFYFYSLCVRRSRLRFFPVTLPRYWWYLVMSKTTNDKRKCLKINKKYVGQSLQLTLTSNSTLVNQLLWELVKDSMSIVHHWFLLG